MTVPDRYTQRTASSLCCTYDALIFLDYTTQYIYMFIYNIYTYMYNIYIYIL
jgi:hypothetical protein